MTWRIDPDGPLGARDEAFAYRHPRAGLRTRLARLANNRLNTLVSKEDDDLVENVQAGLETRGFELGAAVAPRGRHRLVRRPDPRGPRVTGAAATERGARERILAAAVERIASDGIDEVRIARIAMDAGVSTSLVHYHFETRDALLEQALEYSYELAGDVRLGPRGRRR